MQQIQYWTFAICTQLLTHSWLQTLVFWLKFPWLVHKLSVIPLWFINRSKKWGKNIQAAIYEGACTVCKKSRNIFWTILAIVLCVISIRIHVVDIDLLSVNGILTVFSPLLTAKLWNQVPFLDHFVVQNFGDFLCWKYR